MRRLAGKLAFVHRTLWLRDNTYRWAALLGPPPAIGVAVAVLCLAAPRLWPGASGTPGRQPWAHWTPPVPQGEQSFVEPTVKLPTRDAGGRYQGLQAGWRGEVHPISIDATHDVDVSDAVVASFPLDQPDIALQRVVDAGPPGGLFVAVAQGLFVARTPGSYAFSVRLTRTGTQSADCLERLSTKSHRIIRNIDLNSQSGAVLTYPAARIRLEPGLLMIGVAVGCWRGERVLGGGDLTLMVLAPGETALRPATPDEIMGPAG